jgi:hypothetical protein
MEFFDCSGYRTKMAHFIKKLAEKFCIKMLPDALATSMKQATLNDAFFCQPFDCASHESPQ